MANHRIEKLLILEASKIWKLCKAWKNFKTLRNALNVRRNKKLCWILPFHIFVASSCDQFADSDFFTNFSVLNAKHPWCLSFKDFYDVLVSLLSFRFFCAFPYDMWMPVPHSDFSFLKASKTMWECRGLQTNFVWHEEKIINQKASMLRGSTRMATRSIIVAMRACE